MASTEELTKQLEVTLRRIHTILYKCAQSVATDREISALQLNALLSIREHGPLTMGDVCKNLFVPCSTATDLADRMERARLVERIRDSKDRRVVRLHLLAKGNEVLEAVVKERQRFLGEVLKDYTNEEYLEMLRGLEQLAKRMEVV